MCNHCLYNKCQGPIAVFFWCSFSIKLSWLQRINNKINTILYDRYYLQKCKVITFLKKLQIIQNMKNLMFQVIFIFFGWILIKQIIASYTPFCCWGNRSWGETWVGRGMSKNASNQCIFCELHKFENLSNTWWNSKIWKKIQQAFWREMKP